MSHYRKSSLLELIDSRTYAPESSVLEELIRDGAPDEATRRRISQRAAGFVVELRTQRKPGLMEAFLSEYGLSTDEGVALMCLAEALLRVPDPETIDALIDDKIASSDWSEHLNQSTSPLVNASTWALMLTGQVLNDAPPGPAAVLKSVVRRLGEPIIRTAVSGVMKEMGRQFVLGESIGGAMERGSKMESRGYTYSYDMLGEASLTAADALDCYNAYADAIDAISVSSTKESVRDNPGISVKLSALHPRCEFSKRARVIAELVPRLLNLARKAKSANMGLNVDAEEADRLFLSLEVIQAVLEDDSLAGWDGFGVVVQAYSLRAGPVIDYLYELAGDLDRNLMIRLVKGAYWDTEIKKAQVTGVQGFPVFTTKAATDISYIANASKLIKMTDRLYPQFATHNAHTASAILEMASDRSAFEFQRLHGMGEALHDLILKSENTRCRIYAPVGAHQDLLAYLVRRLLENGANSSFVHQLIDESVPVVQVTRDPFETIGDSRTQIGDGTTLFEPERKNSRGFDFHHLPTVGKIENARSPYQNSQWQAAPLLPEARSAGARSIVDNPAEETDVVGTVEPAAEADVLSALGSAQIWDASYQQRAEVLRKAADIFESNHGEIFALLARESGKTLADAVAELREAVDFLRYYAVRATGDVPLGIVVCISPWNFPLAIFTGQVGAALAAGNAVLAKPAEQTPLIAYRAVQWMHEAGVPPDVLQLLPGDGRVGARLISDARVKGIVFTGSTKTARDIKIAKSENLLPGVPLIAETGGINAMIVDSTALLQQAVKAIVESAFQSAGQRCSALRCLYVQQDVFDSLVEMLIGAMNELDLGNPWYPVTDCGPLIDQASFQRVNSYIEQADLEGRVLHEIKAPATGNFVGPALVKVDGILALQEEIFGPVLHIATFEADAFEAVVDTINSTGYGLTFSLQTRIDDRVQYVSRHICAGNIYVNRNQVGAVVGSQPFGGEGLSGTGPKAGGPWYLTRFYDQSGGPAGGDWTQPADIQRLQSAIDQNHNEDVVQSTYLDGPTGESNQWIAVPRKPVLCLGPGTQAADSQVDAVRKLGGVAVESGGELAPESLENLGGFCAVIWWGDEQSARGYEAALSRRTGDLVPLITGLPDAAHVCHERCISVDITAAGGNASLLSMQ